jgi:hypothetical protein
MSRLVFLAVLLLLGGCDALTSNEEHAFRVCEAHIQKQLRSPATYARVKAISAPAPDGGSIRTVHIEYDASNAYGTPVRGVEGCAFEVGDDGEFPDRSRLELGASQAALAEAENRLAELKGERKPNDLDGLYSCCISGEARALAMKNYMDVGDFTIPIGAGNTAATQGEGK